MVFAINAPTTGNTFDKFKAAAMATSGSSSSTVPTATTSSGGSYVTPPPPPDPVTVTVTVTAGASAWTSVYGSYPGSSWPTANPQPIVHQVTVGGDNTLTFNPTNITAQPNDIVQFSTFFSTYFYQVLMLCISIHVQESHRNPINLFQSMCCWFGRRRPGFRFGIPTGCQWNHRVPNL